MVALAACSAKEAAPVPATASATAPTASPLLVQLERGACLGRCPEYGVSLYADGRVRYEGVRHTTVLGEQTRQVDADAVRRLHADLLAAGAATADSAYGYGHPACASYATDLPSVVLTVRNGEALKRIQFDIGCGGAPAFLSVFPARIDSLAATSTWVRRPEGAP